jgi:RHS repeat-associated protein
MVQTYDYDPYGNPTQAPATGPVTDFRYAGMFYHADSGLYLTKYRAYDPRTGRWLSRDPLQEIAGINLYQYVVDNPVRNTDPLGLVGLCDYEKEIIKERILEVFPTIEYDPYRRERILAFLETIGDLDQIKTLLQRIEVLEDPSKRLEVTEKGIRRIESRRNLARLLILLRRVLDKGGIPVLDKGGIPLIGPAIPDPSAGPSPSPSPSPKPPV